MELFNFYKSKYPFFVINILLFFSVCLIVISNFCSGSVFCNLLLSLGTSTISGFILFFFINLVPAYREYKENFDILKPELCILLVYINRFLAVNQWYQDTKNGLDLVELPNKCICFVGRDLSDVNNLHKNAFNPNAQFFDSMNRILICADKLKNKYNILDKELVKCIEILNNCPVKNILDVFVNNKNSNREVIMYGYKELIFCLNSIVDKIFKIYNLTEVRYKFEQVSEEEFHNLQIPCEDFIEGKGLENIFVESMKMKR